MEIRESLDQEYIEAFDKMITLNAGKNNTQKMDSIFEWLVYSFGESIRIGRCVNCGQLIVNDESDNFNNCKSCRE